MKKSRFTEKQVLSVLQEQDLGKTVEAITREHGISAATFYKWKSKYAGMSEQELARLRQLEQDNARLRRIVADQQLDISIMKDLLAKKW